MSLENENIMIGWTTFPDKQSCEEMVKLLVTQKIIACGQIDGPIESCYMWEGSLCLEKEWRLVVKYPKNRRKDVEAIIVKTHPYKLPQWLTTEVECSKEYKDWVRGILPNQ
jgi:periplasmic divalent cation tolerance protein